MEENPIFSQKGTAIPRGMSSQAVDADPSDQSGGFAANIGTPVWRQFVDNQGFQEANKGAIDAEKDYQSRTEQSNRSRAPKEPGGRWSTSGGKLFRSIGDGLNEEHDPESLADHPEVGGLARKSIWDKDREAYKRQSDDLNFRLKDPTDRRSLTDKERTDLELETGLGDGSEESNTRIAEVKKRLSDADQRRAEEKSAFDAESNRRAVESTDPDTWYANRRKPELADRRVAALKQADDRKAQIEQADNSASKEMAALNERMLSGVKGDEINEIKGKMADLSAARAEIAKEKNRVAAETTAPVQTEADQKLRGDRKKISDDVFGYMKESGRASQGSMKSVGDQPGNDSRYLERATDLAGKSLGAAGGLIEGGAKAIGVMAGAKTDPWQSLETGIIDEALASGDLVSEFEKSKKAGFNAIAGYNEQKTKVLGGLIDRFNQHGITDGKEMGTIMKDAALENVWASGDGTKVRKLSDGRLAYNPSLVAQRDPKDVFSAIEASGGSDAEKSITKEHYEFARNHFAADLHARLLGKDPDYAAHVKQAMASGENDPSALVYSWDKMSPGWFKKNGDLLADIGIQTGRTVMNSLSALKAEAGFLGSEGANAVGLDGASSWLKSVASGSTAAMEDRMAKDDYDEALAAARGERGTTAGVVKNFGVTAGAMIPMLAGGIGGGLIKSAGLKAGSAAAVAAGKTIQGASVYGYSGMQGVQSIFESAIQEAQKKTQGRKLTDEERYSVISDNQIPAIANGLQTILLTKLGSGGGVERAAFGTVGAGGGKLTMREIVTQFAKSKSSLKSTLSELKPEIFAMLKTVRHDFADEALEEGANQLIEGFIGRASVTPDMTLEEVANQTLLASAMGGVLGSAMPGAISMLTKNDMTGTHKAMQYALAKQLLAGPAKGRVDAALTKVDPAAAPATEDELKDAHNLSFSENVEDAGMKEITAKTAEYQAARKSGNLTEAARISDEINKLTEDTHVRTADRNAEGVLISRDIEKVRADDEAFLQEAEDAHSNAVASGDSGAVAAAEKALEKADYQRSRASLASAVIKLSSGQSLADLTASELSSVGYKGDGAGGFVPMDMAELKAAGMKKPLVVPGADESAIVLDEAIRAAKSAVPRAAGRLTVDETEQKKRSVARKKAADDAQAKADAEAKAASTNEWDVTLKSGKTIRVKAADAAGAEVEAAAQASEPIVKNSAKQASGTSPPAAAASPAGKKRGDKAMKAAEKRIAALRKSKKLDSVIVVSTDPKVRARATETRIFVNPSRIIAEAVAEGMTDGQAARYFARMLDEEIRHYAHTLAALNLWQKSPINLPFTEWKEAHYDGIWKSDFAGTEKEAIIRSIYAADITTAEKGGAKNFDDLPDWKKAMEAIRMMSQGGNKATETGRLWIGITDTLRKALTAALEALKSIISGIDDHPSLKKEIELLEEALKDLKNDTTPPPGEEGDGADEESPPGDGGADQDPVEESGPPPEVGSKVEFTSGGEVLTGRVTKIKKGAAAVRLDKPDSKGIPNRTVRVRDLRVIIDDAPPADTPPPPATPPPVTKESAIRSISEWVVVKLSRAEAITKDDLDRIQSENPTFSKKEVEEIVEAGISQAMRDIMALPESDREKYEIMLSIYEHLQPKLTAKTSTSKVNQAYSTPPPMALVASILADVSNGRIISEGTFGHGMLLMGTTGKQVVQANEIDQGRIERTRAAVHDSVQWDITSQDATTWTPRMMPDRILGNPPFGQVMDANMANTRYQTAAGETTQIDHAIMLRQLSYMAPDGRAVFLIGGPPPFVKGEDGRKAFYDGAMKGAFYKYLYATYGVVDHFTIAGDLYAKQGAGWPVDVIVIQGQKSTGIDLPSFRAPRMISNWDQLFKTTELTDEQRIEQNTTPPEEILDGLRKDLEKLTKGSKGKRDGGIQPDNGDGLGGELDDREGGLPPEAPGGGPGGNGKGNHGHPNGIPAGTDPGIHPNPGGGNGGSGGVAPDNGGNIPGGSGSSGGRKSVTPRALTALEQEAADAFNDLFAAPLRPDGFKEKIPRDKVATFMALADKFISAGVNSTAKLAEALIAMGNSIGKNLRVFSDAFWSLFRAMDTDLPQAESWEETYRSIEPEPQPEPDPEPEPKDPVVDPEEKENVNMFQDKNIPVSQGKSLETLAPKNLSSAMRESLLRLQERIGPLHEFVHKELGYPPGDDIFKYFAAEQLDALALAIDNFYQNGALIVGDQTGVGKGRIVAGLIKWSIHKGLIPVFVTKNPSLMNAMLEDDLPDIGVEEITPAITNNRNDKIVKNIKLLSKRKIPMGKTVFEDIELTGEMPPGADVIFTTYSQISADAEPGLTPRDRAFWASRKQAPPDGYRMKALAAIADRSVMILDESHLASGESIIGYRFRKLLANAKHVYFSSATFAKRPSSMALYFRTNMKHVISDGDMNKLIEIMDRGGVPAMQMASYMLAKDGQMLRRERDFDGISFETVISHSTADNDIRRGDVFTGGLRDIVLMQGEMTAAAEEVNDILKAMGKEFKVPAANRPDKIESTNFSGKLHNLISQFMLSIKVDAVVEQARIEILGDGTEKNPGGRKVVVALQNTMESGIEKLREEGRPLNYREMLLSHLDTLRTFKMGGGREFTVSREGPEEFNHRSDKWLEDNIGTVVQGLDGRPALRINEPVVMEIVRRRMISVFLETEKRISKLKIDEDLPLSPIDEIKRKIGEFGVTANEITGRGMGLDEDGEAYKREIPGAVDVMNEFNTGDTMLLVLNQSGSTGISLHDSEKNENAGKHPRTMIVAQPNLDINEFMQMLGRIHRSGQKSLPKFVLLQSALPSERRPAAVLGLKMAMLNANTTSNDSSAVSTGNRAVDIFNDYGDDVVYAHLMTDRDLVRQLAMFPTLVKNHITTDGSVTSKGEMEPGGFARRITGYLAVMPVEEQDLFWEKVTEEYIAKIKYLDEIGENALKAQPIDMKAKTLSKRIFTPGKDLDSIFADASYYETVEGVFGRPPATEREARDAKEEMWDERADMMTSFRRKATAEIQRQDALKATKVHKWSEKRNEWISAQQRQMQHTLDAIDKSGRWLEYKRDDGTMGLAVVQSADINEEKTLAPSSQTFKLLLNDTKHSIRVPATHMHKYTIPTKVVSNDAWDATMDNNTTRTIVTGNLLAALGELQGIGKIITYTKDNGDTEMGIMMPSDFTAREGQKRERRIPIATPEEFVESLLAGGKISNSDETLLIKRAKSGDIAIKVPAKRKHGGKFWRNPALNALMDGGEFTDDGSGQWSVSSIPQGNLPTVFNILNSMNERLSSDISGNDDGDGDDDTDTDPDDDGGGLDAAPLIRSDSDKWKGMSKQERTDYLTKRKQNIKRAKLRVRIPRAALTDMALSQENWKDWYSSHQELLDNFFGDHATIFQKLLSATSQASSVKANVTHALKAFGMLLRAEEFTGFLKAVIGNLERVRGTERMSVQKISAFDDANEGADVVVVDRHIARMLFGTSSPSKAQFAKAQRVLTEIATEIGWTPQQVQASLWAASIVKSGKTPEGYATYLQTLEAKKGIHKRIGNPVSGSWGAHVQGGDRGRYSGRGKTAVEETGLDSAPLTAEDSEYYDSFESDESRDEEYIRLVKDSWNNRDKIESLVIAAASKKGYKDGPLYHNSKSDERFDVFDFDYAQHIGMHFGTKGQARKVTKGEQYVVFVNRGKSLRIGDGGSFFGGWVDMVDEALLEEHGFRHRELSDIKTSAELVEFLQSLGYDSLVYENIGEASTEGLEFDTDYGIGSSNRVYDDSIILFRPNQIKSGNHVTVDEEDDIIPLSRRFRSWDDSILYSAPLTGSTSENIKSLRIIGNSRMSKDMLDEARLTQDAFDEDGDRIVGAPRLANIGDSEQSRNEQRINDALYEHDREIRQDRSVMDEARRRFEKDPKGIEEKVLESAFVTGELLTDVDNISVRYLINKRAEEAGNDLAKHEANMVLRMAYRLTRANLARSMRIGFDMFQTPAERNREHLTEAIYAPTLNIEQRAQSDNWSPQQKREFILEASKTRLSMIEKAFKDMGVTLDEILSGHAYLSLSKSAVMKDALGSRSAEDTMVIEMHQKKWPISRIKAATGLSEERINQIAKKLYDELMAQARIKAAAGVTLDDYVDDDDHSLRAAALTPEEIEAEARRIVEIGLGIAPVVSTTSTFKPKVTKSANPLTADWSRPVFTNGLKSYTFKTADRADILRRVTEIRALAAATGKIKTIKGSNQKKAIEHLKAIDAILAKHGTSAAEIFASDTPTADYRFDIRDRNQVAIIARVIQAIDSDIVDKTMEWTYSAILSGIQTMTVNALAAVPALWDMTVGRGFEMAMNVMFQDPMSASFGEVKYILRAAGPALSRAMSNAAATWGSETPMFDEDVLGRSSDIDKLFDGKAPKIGVIGGRKGRLIRVPTRMLLATDEFNRTAIAVMEVGAMAYRLARKKGLKPGTAKFDRFLKIQVNTPGSLSSKLAADKAAKLIFTSVLPGQFNPVTGKRVEIENMGDIPGMIGAGINKLVTHNTNNLMTKSLLAAIRLFFFPFQRTPFNLLRRGVRHTLNPISLIDITVLFGRNSYAVGADGHRHWKWNGGGRNAEIVERLAQQMQGAMLLAFFMASGAGEGDDDDLKKKILVTGSQPFTLKGRAERETQYRAGLGPYRISIRNKDGTERFGFNYGRIEPLATALAATIDISKSVKRSIRSGKDWSNASLAALGGLAAQSQDKTYMQGISDLIGLANHMMEGDSDLKDDKKLQQFAASRFGMFIPNIIKQPVRESDNYFRDRADTFMQELLYQAWPNGIKPSRKDTYGEPVAKTGTPLGRVIDVTDAGTSVVSPQDNMLLRWRDKHPDKSWFPSSISSSEWKDPRTKIKAKMNSEQLNMFREKSGKRTAALLKHLNLNTENPTQGDIDKARDATSRAREEVKNILSRTPAFQRLSAKK